MCLCAIVWTKHSKTHTRGKREGESISNPNPRTQNPNNGCLSSPKYPKCLPSQAKRQASPFMALLVLYSLQDKLLKREIPPYTCMKGDKSNSTVLKYLQKQMNSNRPAKNAILAKRSAGRQQIVPAGNKRCRPANYYAGGSKNQPVASSLCRWWVGMVHKPYPASHRQDARVWSKTRL